MLLHCVNSVRPDQSFLLYIGVIIDTIIEQALFTEVVYGKAQVTRKA